VLQDRAKIYLGEIFDRATLSVYDDMTVGILTFGGKSELGRYDVQEEADGRLFIVIPEPSAFGLLAGALALVCAASRRRRK
ncbi:MAG TPA: PEP-CTERM sorting domain-containing protein, partial [Candidatus Spyradosoma merdigallinarum]|nr:PEP-CTERM sorting domain-containing protein [Candidatus Spyradosoma merdigallinarum]